MSTDHRDRHSLQQQHRSQTNNDTYTERHTIDDNTLRTIDIEPEQGCCSKIIVLSAIVLFLSILASSVPNVLSKQQHPLPPSRLVKDTALSTSSPSPDQQHFAQVVNNQHDSRDATGGAAAAGDPWAHMTVGGQPNARAQQGIPTHPAFTQISPPSAYPPPASASASASTSAFSSYQSSQDHQRQQHLPEDSRSKQHSTIWPVIQASAWFAYRASLWSMRTSYWTVRSAVAKPYSVVAALFETPYTMMKDICLAFLPVYSFFTIAAVIGILVGGSAMWIAQLLISAIGAGQETMTTSTAVGYSQSKPVAYHVSQQPIRTFNQGQQGRQEPLSRASSSDRSFGPATIRSDATRTRSTTPLPSRLPAATMQTAPERDARRRRVILTDDDDDDDDDEDDDNDWPRV